MTSNYTLLNYHLNSMVELLIKKFGSQYDEALPIVMSTQTYKMLVDKPFLLEEGKLFVQELLDREISLRAA